MTTLEDSFHYSNESLRVTNKTSIPHAAAPFLADTRSENYKIVWSLVENQKKDLLAQPAGFQNYKKKRNFFFF